MVTTTSTRGYCEACEAFIDTATCWKHPSLTPKWDVQLTLVDEAKPVRWVVFDVETQKLFDECGGRDYIDQNDRWDLLGITVFGVWDSSDNRPYIYDNYTLSEGVSHIESADTVVSFNGNRFDFK